MDIIKDKQKAIDELNEVLFIQNAKETAQHLDDIIFDYVAYQAISGCTMSEYENIRIMTARQIRNFFYSLKDNTNLINDK